MLRTRFPASLGVGLVLTAAYFLAGTHCLSLAQVHPSISSVWPPTGIAVAAMLVLGSRFASAIFVGALLVNLAATGHLPSSFGIAIGNTLECLVAAWLVNRFANGCNAFDRPRTFFAFVLYAAVASTMVSATVGVNCLLWSGLMPWSEFRPAWVTWWLGDAVGAMVFTPLFVMATRPWGAWSRLQACEAAVLFAGLGGISLIAFGLLPVVGSDQPLAFLPMPFLVWAGFRFSPRVAAVAILVPCGISIWCTVRGDGPFARLPVSDQMLMLQVFIGFVAGVALTVAVVTKESRDIAAKLTESRAELECRVRERTAKLAEANEVLTREIAERTTAERSLADSEAGFRDLVESAPVAQVIVDRDGRIAIVNAQTERIFGYERVELLGKPAGMLVPERFREGRDPGRLLVDLIALSRSEELELCGRRKDGSEFPIEISLCPLQTKAGQVFSAAIHDMTRHKQAEQQRLATESLRAQVAELSRRTQDFGALNRMADMLRAARSPKEAYPLVAPFLEELFPANSGAIYVYGESPTLLEAVTLWGKEPPREPVIKSEQCWALRRGQLHWLVAPANAAACQHLEPPLPEASLCIPMVANGEAVGLFHLLRPAARTAGQLVSVREYVDYKQKLAQAVSEQITGAIANAKLHEKLHTQAIRDPLTGLLNRRSLDESLQHELHRARRRQTKLGIVMIDIDHFKRVNDRYGHAAGDHVLREIARLLLRQTRKEDLVYRFGGEEIAVLLVECTLDDLQRRAEQIRENCKLLHLEHDGRSLGPITLSLGVALFPDHGNAAEGLLRAADEALYRAKGEGRDRVAIAATASTNERTVE